MSEKIRSLSNSGDKKLTSRLVVGVIIPVVVLISGFFVVPKVLKVLNVFASSSPWTQTDWSGGTSSSVVTNAVTTYYSSSDLDTATTSGQISLDLATGWSETYSDWGYRKKITFDNTDSNIGVTSEDLTNFPVLIKLDSGSDIDYSKTQDDGDDIRFTDSDGTALNFEIDDWDESGTSYIWVYSFTFRKNA